MRLYGADVCQAEDIGLDECVCQDCTQLRYTRVVQFIAEQRAKRSLYPVASFDADGNLVVESGEHTVPTLDAVRVATEQPKGISIVERLARLLGAA